MGILDGKVAIVTGAAGGLGSAAVRLLAAEGAHVPGHEHRRTIRHTSLGEGIA